MNERAPLGPRAVPTWLCALTSVGLFGVLIGLALHVRLGLGHWPKPMWEKYSTQAFDIHMHVLQAVGLVTVYAAGPLWALFLLIRPFRGSLRLHLLQAAIYGLGWGLIALWCWIDPTRFVQWLLD